MVRLTLRNGSPVCEAQLVGVAVYLDNDSLMDLATGHQGRRDRFVHALTVGGTLLFSWANAIEICGAPSAVAPFLNSIGVAWFPLVLSPWAAAEQEEQGFGERAPFSESLIEAFIDERAGELAVEDRTLLDPPLETLFSLGSVWNWVQTEWHKLRNNKTDIDDKARDTLKQLRMAYDSDPRSLDRMLPPFSYEKRRRVNFALIHLQRVLVHEAKEFPFQRHDGLDFCHAVLAAAYGDLATLDKHWKRRVGKIPKPNGLATIYYRPELDQLVDRLEFLVSSN